MKFYGALGRVGSLFGLLLLVSAVYLRALHMPGPFGVQATNVMFLAEAVMTGGIALILCGMSLGKP